MAVLREVCSLKAEELLTTSGLNTKLGLRAVKHTRVVLTSGYQGRTSIGVQR